MPKCLTLEPHLSCEELEERYRQAKEGIERSQYQILWLLAKDKRTEEVREVTGYSLRWIRVIANRYNQKGEAGVGDSRQHNCGAEPLLEMRPLVQFNAIISPVLCSFGVASKRSLIRPGERFIRLSKECSQIT